MISVGICCVHSSKFKGYMKDLAAMGFQYYLYLKSTIKSKGIFREPQTKIQTK